MESQKEDARSDNYDKVEHDQAGCKREHGEYLYQ